LYFVLFYFDSKSYHTHLMPFASESFGDGDSDTADSDDDAPVAEGDGDGNN
jgi:hypothetical protein